jgi:hypothetical protein
MKKILLVLALLLSLAAMSNAVMDTLVFRYASSIFPKHEETFFLGGTRYFWNPAISWKSKYAMDEEHHLIAVDKQPWYYFGLYRLTYKERFPFSTTALVMFSDGWHLMQFFMLSFFQLAFIFLIHQFQKLKWYYWILLFIGMKVIFGLVFGLFWSNLLVRIS